MNADALGATSHVSACSVIVYWSPKQLGISASETVPAAVEIAFSGFSALAHKFRPR